MAATRHGLDGAMLVEARLDAKPWGGTRLAGLGYAVEGPEPLGEVVLTATGNRVAAGPHAGRTLGELIAADAEGMIGARGLAATGGRPLFPLLVKLIDAAQHLSVQVHPDDARASAWDGLGKTEAWHVLAVEPGAVIFAGLAEGAGLGEVAEAARSADGSAAALLRRLPATAGETIFLPAGTLHALGAGVMVYELQQASETTYRLDDWGRVGADGKPRQMHVAESLEATDPGLRPGYLPPRPMPVDGGEEVRRDLLVACGSFALDRFRLPAGASAALGAEGSAQTVTVVGGAVELVGPGGEAVRVAEGRTAVVPAAAGRVEATAGREGAEVLRAWVPGDEVEGLG